MTEANSMPNKTQVLKFNSYLAVVHEDLRYYFHEKNGGKIRLELMFKGQKWTVHRPVPEPATGC